MYRGKCISLEITFRIKDPRVVLGMHSLVVECAAYMWFIILDRERSHKASRLIHTHLSKPVNKVSNKIRSIP